MNDDYNINDDDIDDDDKQTDRQIDCSVQYWGIIGIRWIIELITLTIANKSSIILLYWW